MLARNEREALLAVAERLSIELGYSGDEEIPGTDSVLGGENGAMAGILDPEDELLVRTVRRSLARVAAALVGEGTGVGPRRVRAALDGVELVIRGELMNGNAAQLPTLMPSFVFLVALTVVDQDRALELSRRTAALVEGLLG